MQRRLELQGVALEPAGEEVLRAALVEGLGEEEAAVLVEEEPLWQGR